MNFRIAKFSNGTVLKRSSMSRIYSHAYLAAGKRPDGSTWAMRGFSSSEEQARRNMNSECKWQRNPGYTTEISEVVPCQAVETRKEFKAV